jgi:hypothetical protein
VRIGIYAPGITQAELRFTFEIGLAKSRVANAVVIMPELSLHEVYNLAVSVDDSLQLCHEHLSRSADDRRKRLPWGARCVAGSVILPAAAQTVLQTWAPSPAKRSEQRA